jgi:hypothetical protein
MSPSWLVVPALVLAAAAQAQTAPIRSEQLPPLQQQWQQQGSPPVQQAPVVPDATSQGQQLPAVPPPVAATPPATPTPGTATGPTAPTPATVERPNTWLPGTVVKLQALDKVNAQSVALTIKVGDSAAFGSLTITAKACVLRPTDQPADAAAFLAITDSHPDSAGFSGWMLEDEPSVSMMENPIYDLRVTGCA